MPLTNAQLQKAHRTRRKAERDRMTKALKAIKVESGVFFALADLETLSNLMATIYGLAKEGLGDE